MYPLALYGIQFVYAAIIQNAIQQYTSHIRQHSCIIYHYRGAHHDNIPYQWLERHPIENLQNAKMYATHCWAYLCVCEHWHWHHIKQHHAPYEGSRKQCACCWYWMCRWTRQVEIPNEPIKHKRYIIRYALQYNITTSHSANVFIKVEKAWRIRAFKTAAVLCQQILHNNQNCMLLTAYCVGNLYWNSVGRLSGSCQLLMVGEENRPKNTFRSFVCLSVCRHMLTHVNQPKGGPKCPFGQIWTWNTEQ